MPAVRRYLLLPLMLLAAPSLLAGALPEAVDGEPLPTLAPMVERVTPAVVNVATRTRLPGHESPLLRDPFFRFFFGQQRRRPREGQSLGSGVIIDAAEGLVITNNHVIDKATEIQVSLHDGRRLRAQVVGVDPESDVAVIRVPAENLVAVPLADSSQLRVGDFVVAIGNPFGLGQTVTSGIVSALGRTGLGIEGYEDFIQTDASINPGNSGGALVNLRGELVGINTAIYGPGGGSVGINFAIPVNMAREIVEQLVVHGEVRRGSLGVTAQDLTPPLAKALGVSADTRGAVVVEVAPGSPAAGAGLQPGDIVLSANGRPIVRAGDVRNVVGLARVGERIDFEVMRDGRRLSMVAVVAPPPGAQLSAERVTERLAGAVFSDIAPATPLYGKVRGVLVTSVEPSSPAGFSGLRRGDIVQSVNRVAVTDIDTFARAVTTSGSALVLGVLRDGASLFLLVR